MRFVELQEIPAGTCLPNIRLYTTTTKSGGWGYGAQHVALVHNPHSRTHANASDTLSKKKTNRDVFKKPATAAEKK